MATVQGFFSNNDQAQSAVAQLRGMDISLEDISVNTQSGGEGGSDGVLVIAQVPDGQRSAAQSILDGAGASAAPVATSTGDYEGGALSTGGPDRGGGVSDPRNIDDDEGTLEHGIATGGGLAMGIGGSSMTGGLGPAGGSVLGSAAVARFVDTDDARSSADDTSANTTDTPGTFMGGGATSAGVDRPSSEDDDGGRA